MNFRKIPTGNWSSSRTLTAMIVASVVVMNFLAWGIPVLMASSGTAVDGRRIQTGSIPRLPIAMRDEALLQPGVRQHAAAVPPARHIVLSRPARIAMPLPIQAPRSFQIPVLPTKLASHRNKVEPATLISGRPATLFPMPVSKAVTRTMRVAQTAVKTPAVLPSSGIARLRQATIGAELKAKVPQQRREVVLVSPYTPGVRTMARERMPAVSGNVTRSTYESARVIAMRAAKRFEQMRERMAQINATDRLPLGQTQPQRGLMPVDLAPPRIVGRVGLSSTKSAHHYVRARLVRRPIGPAIEPPARVVDEAVPGAVNAPRVESRRVAALHTDNGSAQRARVAPQRSPARDQPSLEQISQKRQQQLRAQRRKAAVHHARIRRSKKVRRRLARSRDVRRNRARRSRRRNARASRRIDGFRRSFHRQLVASNFFSARN